LFEARGRHWDAKSPRAICGALAIAAYQRRDLESGRTQGRNVRQATPTGTSDDDPDRADRGISHGSVSLAATTAQ
jgi:hypothetical protein